MDLISTITSALIALGGPVKQTPSISLWAKREAEHNKNVSNCDKRVIFIGVFCRDKAQQSFLSTKFVIMSERIIIIGNGISGITAARHIRKRSDHEIIVISGETDYFFSRTALMYIYMGHMTYEHTKPYEDHFWEKNRIQLLRNWVTDVNPNEHTITLQHEEKLHYDKLILALGSASNKFGWPGQDLPGVQGLYNYQDLQLLEKNTKNIEHGVVVGGGLIGVELAEMLHSRGIHTSFLVRDNDFWGNILPSQDAQFIERHIRSQGIDLRMKEEMTEVIEGANGRASGVRLKSDGSILDCQLVGLCAGVHPNIGLVRDNDAIETHRGIKVNEFLETSAKDVYAIGDCAQFQENPDPERPPIEQVWYTGRMMGECVAKTLSGEQSAYAPGQWFNSAKFFDIEYQTYGWVRSAMPDDEDEFFWESTDGLKAIHFRWKKETQRFVGVNTFGIRLRHETFDAWLNSKATIQEVIQELKTAHFDPELYRTYYKKILASFNASIAIQA